MLTTIVAILGTLAGAVITGTFAHLTQRSHQADAKATARRTEGINAVTDLVTALADHRRAMWVREDLRLRGQDWDEARAASHATRSAITAPLLRVAILLPELAPAAQTAARATYGLRGAGDEGGLRIAREHAITLSDQLVTDAGTALNA